jgi:hypothetical protein
MIIAILSHGLVTNTVEWPGERPIPDNAVDVADRAASIGWTFDGLTFSPPPPDPVVTEAEAIASILAKDDADITDEELRRVTLHQAREG